MSIWNQEISVKSIGSALGSIGKKDKVPAKQETLKTTINFVGINETHENWGLAIPGVIVIVVAAILISKFAVADRYARLWSRQAEVTNLEKQLADGMEAINQSSELSDKFYHYTWSMMTEEERNRVSRVDIADLITFISTQISSVNSYTISGDTLTVNITAPTLESISRLAVSVEDRAIVESCSVQTAQTDTQGDVSGGVDAQLVIYIQKPTEEDAVVTGSEPQPAVTEAVTEAESESAVTEAATSPAESAGQE